MYLAYFHYAIVQEYNLRRTPVLDKFVKNYEGEIKYVFSNDYVVEIIDTDHIATGIHSGIRLSSWGHR
jgi:hypothetical protein